MKLSNRSSQSHTIRTLAAARAETERAPAHLAVLELYELKHRAITWMITPRESGGLGVGPPTATCVAGHVDAGRTIVRFYLRLEEEAAVARVRHEMEIHEGAARLRVVSGSLRNKRTALPRTQGRSDRLLRDPYTCQSLNSSPVPHRIRSNPWDGSKYRIDTGT